MSLLAVCFSCSVVLESYALYLRFDKKIWTAGDLSWRNSGGRARLCRLLVQFSILVVFIMIISSHTLFGDVSEDGMLAIGVAVVQERLRGSSMPLYDFKVLRKQEWCIVSGKGSQQGGRVVSVLLKKAPFEVKIREGGEIPVMLD